MERLSGDHPVAERQLRRAHRHRRRAHLPGGRHGARCWTGMEALAAVAALYLSLYPGATSPCRSTRPAVLRRWPSAPAARSCARRATRPRWRRPARAAHVGLAGQGNGSFHLRRLPPGARRHVRHRPLVELTAQLAGEAVRRGARPAEVRHGPQGCGLPLGGQGQGHAPAERALPRRRHPQVDGVKIMANGNEWALILPDADQPIFHIIAEARTNDRATPWWRSTAPWWVRYRGSGRAVAAGAGLPAPAADRRSWHHSCAPRPDPSWRRVDELILRILPTRPPGTARAGPCDSAARHRADPPRKSRR